MDCTSYTFAYLIHNQKLDSHPFGALTPPKAPVYYRVQILSRPEKRTLKMGSKDELHKVGLLGLFDNIHAVQLNKSKFSKE